MLFNSLEFLIFLPVCFAVYWSLGRFVRLQNLFLIVASYVFYGWADWRYMGLIGGYTLWSFLSGLLLGRLGVAWKRKAVLWSTVTVNVGVLCLYKYFDFFVGSFNALFESFGLSLDWPTLNLILPIGISFYTFQAMSYTIDVYRRNIAPTRDVVSFFAFLSFFPQLVAGPIERADTLLPQFLRRRSFTYGRGVCGMKRILWGLFKKMVVADNCALFVNYVFGNIYEMNSISLFLGILFFTFQVYCDFSGYSDIAVGCGRLFGIELRENFKLPFFSRNVREFWTRWHVSLNDWFRDYVYFPLGGSRGSLWLTVVNLLIVFTLSGVWHGAAWTMVAWGFLNGVLVVLLLLGSRMRGADLRRGNGIFLKAHTPLRLRIGAVLSNLFLMISFMLTMVLFRCQTLRETGSFIKRMFRCRGGWEVIYHPWLPSLVFIIVLLLIEYLNRGRGGTIDIGRAGIMRYKPVRWGFYWIFALSTFLMAGNEAPFIYFQF